jgi:hypothetical protein
MSTDDDSQLPAERPQSPARKTFVLKRQTDVAAPTFRIRYADELNASQLAVVEQIEGGARGPY